MNSNKLIIEYVPLGTPIKPYFEQDVYSEDLSPTIEKLPTKHLKIEIREPLCWQCTQQGDYVLLRIPENYEEVPQNERKGLLIHEFWHPITDAKHPEYKIRFQKFFSELSLLRLLGLDDGGYAISYNLLQSFSDFYLMWTQCKEGAHENAHFYAQRILNLARGDLKVPDLEKGIIPTSTFQLYLLTALPFKLEGISDTALELEGKVKSSFHKDVGTEEVNSGLQTAKELEEKLKLNHLTGFEYLEAILPLL